MRIALLLAALLLASAPLRANPVVRPAPDVTWVDASGKTQSLEKFRGQPVVLLVAPSPKSWAFRSQVGQLQQLYQRFAASKLVCLAAFTSQPGPVKSNIPFAQVADGPRAGFLYNAGKGFAIGIIGQDGNLDYTGTKVVDSQRIYDIIANSYAVQEAMRH